MKKARTITEKAIQLGRYYHRCAENTRKDLHVFRPKIQVGIERMANRLEARGERYLVWAERREERAAERYYKSMLRNVEV